MTFNPVSVIEPIVPPSPLVISSPHSGRQYPDDFAYICPFALLKQTEDSYVDELVAGAVDSGVTLVAAEFPRSYIDLNRAEDDIDPALLSEPWPGFLQPSDRTLLGLGLVRRLCKSGVPVYAAPLKAAEIEARITNYYRPYHVVLAQTLISRHRLFGEAYLIDCHSMPGRSYDGRGLRQPDFVLGDLTGSSCDMSFTRQVRDILQDLGYNVALNDPYKGMEIMRRYGKPQHGQHALQLEINRKLYMNEDTLQKNQGFAGLAGDLKAFFKALSDDLLREISVRQAAE
jgi:N-formylglutamate amidohydrolase